MRCTHPMPCRNHHCEMSVGHTFGLNFTPTHGIGRRSSNEQTITPSASRRPAPVLLASMQDHCRCCVNITDIALLTAWCCLPNRCRFVRRRCMRHSICYHRTQELRAQVAPACRPIAGVPFIAARRCLIYSWAPLRSPLLRRSRAVA